MKKNLLLALFVGILIGLVAVTFSPPELLPGVVKSVGIKEALFIGLFFGIPIGLSFGEIFISIKYSRMSDGVKEFFGGILGVFLGGVVILTIEIVFFSAVSWKSGLAFALSFLVVIYASFLFLNGRKKKEEPDISPEGILLIRALKGP